MKHPLNLFPINYDIIIAYTKSIYNVNRIQIKSQKFR